MTKIKLVVPKKDIAAFYDRMLSGGTYFSDDSDVLYNKSVEQNGVVAAFRVETQDRQFRPRLTVNTPTRTMTLTDFSGGLYKEFTFIDFGKSYRVFVEPNEDASS